MIPGMNSRQAQAMMRKMGIKQEEVDAVEVIIKTTDKEIVIKSPQVTKVNMMGQETFQVIGEIEERPLDEKPDISVDDIKIVIDQTGASEEKVREIIEKNNGDLAKAIMDLKS